MTKFNVGDKVLPISKYGKKEFHSVVWKRAKENKQDFIFVSGFRGDIIICSNEKTARETGDFFREIDLRLYKTKPTKNQRITALEKEVSELKLIVHELCDRPQLTTVVNNIQQPSTNNTVEDIIEFEGQQYRKVDREAREGDVVMFSVNNIHYRSNKSYKVIRNVEFTDEDGKVIFVYNKLKRTPENVDVYELIKAEPLSPNQQRAEIILKAKEFVVENKSKIHPGNGERTTVRFVGNFTDILEFVVNVEKRTVVALIKGVASGDLYAKGIAKCNPSDVFNEHIGKAIALGRALGLDVSEFEQAVQPTEIVNGAIYESVYIDGTINYREEANVGLNFEYVNEKLEHGRRGTFNSTNHNARIINDSNAQYGGVE
ncbi:hypothetical protein ACIQZG_04370 [Lysinibacillus sp. NPDC096418]|uniref:hypothetical protein n=1 Tax=Lysinibacillus sp. NPDC096418 TaxID=3364138 RepID=UPI00382035CE